MGGDRSGYGRWKVEIQRSRSDNSKTDKIGGRHRQQDIKGSKPLRESSDT